MPDRPYMKDHGGFLSRSAPIGLPRSPSGEKIISTHKWPVIAGLDFDPAHHTN